MHVATDPILEWVQRNANQIANKVGQSLDRIPPARIQLAARRLFLLFRNLVTTGHLNWNKVQKTIRDLPPPGEEYQMEELPETQREALPEPEYSQPEVQEKPFQPKSQEALPQKESFQPQPYQAQTFQAESPVQFGVWRKKKKEPATAAVESKAEKVQPMQWKPKEVGAEPFIEQKPSIPERAEISPWEQRAAEHWQQFRAPAKDWQGPQKPAEPMKEESKEVTGVSEPKVPSAKEAHLMRPAKGKKKTRVTQPIVPSARPVKEEEPEKFPPIEKPQPKEAESIPAEREVKPEKVEAAPIKEGSRARLGKAKTAPIEKAPKQQPGMAGIKAAEREAMSQPETPLDKSKQVESFPTER